MNRPAAPAPVRSQPYTAAQWAVRRQFMHTVEQICADRQISVDWLSDYWVGRLQQAGQIRYIVGYSFPANNAGAAAISRDKVATYQVLSRAGIPSIPHWALHFPDNTSGPESIREQTAAALELARLPLVVKPCSESSGKDVYKVTTRAALTARLALLAAHYRVAAVSPFCAGDEFRAIMNGSQLRVLFRKQTGKGPREWRHNLSLGSLPAPVDDAALAQALTDLARRTMTELGLALAAVDIIQTAEGPQVLEVNSGFSMHYLAQDPTFQALTEDVYQEAMSLIFA